MPPLLTARNLPQTLLLIALFLLIAVATTLLACGPVAQPAPAADVALPAAPDNDGSNTPAANIEESTDNPASYPEISAGTESSENSGNSQETYPTNPPPPPLPTLRYPNLEHKLDKLAIEADESQGPGGQSDTGQTNPEIMVVVWLSTHPDDAETKTLTEWLKTQGVTQDRFTVGGLIGQPGSVIYATVPAHLLGPISQFEGVVTIHDASGQIAKPAGQFAE